MQTLREELSAKNRELSRRERMAALGEMAAGMAHEIRNPLGGIQLYTSMLADDLQDMPEALELAQKITAGVKRLESLVGQVLQFTREMQAHPVESDLAQIIEQAIELAGERIGPRGTECLAEGPRPMVVRVDPLMMGQAVLNLLINAVEALGGRGEVRIEWGEIDGGHWLLRIRDSGPGISASALERIFHPFFSTKETGTGLGLAIVHRIVEAHDGAITAGNHPEGGAVFEIRI